MRRTLGRAMVLAAALGPGCSAKPYPSSDGDTDASRGGSSSPVTGGSSGATSAGGNVASGGVNPGGSAGTPAPGGSGGNPPATLAGTWQIAGSQTLDCDGSATTEAIEGALTLVPGAGSELVVERSGCSIYLDVQGDVARYRAGQSCTGGDPGTLAFDISYDAASSFTLLDASSASWHERATARFFNTSSSIDCVNTMNAGLGR